MTDEEENSSKKLREQLEVVRDKNILLEEKLKLQKTSWLYLHHLSLSILFGFTYGLIVTFILYVVMYALNLSPATSGLIRQVIIAFGFFISLSFPSFSLFPPILFLKAPKFSTNSLIFYVFSFVFFESLLVYVDPLRLWMPQYQGVARLDHVILPMVYLQGIILAGALSLVPLVANRCGHRLVLDGSVFGFEVNADITAVSEQLSNLEEDFKLVQEKRGDEPNLLYFTKTTRKKKTVLQFSLRPNEKKTNVVLVMHSITNDIPMRAGRDEVERIGKTLMKWLEVSKDFKVIASENEQLIKEIAQESKKSFYRRPVALPSKKVVEHFLRAHWKDAAIILSLLVAVLGWLFPLR